MNRTINRTLGRAGALLAMAWLCGPAGATSLYREGGYQALTADRKAHQPGDLVTVMVVENASATSSANTRTGRDAGVSGQLDLPVKSRAAGVHVNNQLDGRGQTVREGRLLAQITVTVRAVMPNGDLLVGGEQLLEVNNERQQIKLEGRVRLQDLSDMNTVLSTRIADARISYVGKGDLSDTQRPGWWQRALTWFGL